MHLQIQFQDNAASVETKVNAKSDDTPSIDDESEPQVVESKDVSRKLIDAI